MICLSSNRSSLRFQNLKIPFYCSDVVAYSQPRINPRHFPGYLAAINNALRYHSIVTSRRIAYVIGFIWTLSLLVAVFPFLGWREVRPRVLGGYCQYHLNLAPSYILFLHITVCLTPLTITCMAYCKIFQVARLQAQKIASMTVRGDSDAFLV